MMEEETYLTSLLSPVGDSQAANQEIPIEVNDVAAVDAELQVIVGELDLRDQGVFSVAQIVLPPIVIEPGEAAIDPDSGMTDVSVGLVMQTHVRPVNVTQVVARVEVYQHVAVADRQVARHGGLLTPT
jgi:hypothetical protein